MPAAEKPVLLLTCGDPAGIGPEVVVKAWDATPAHARARLRVVADAGMLADALTTRAGLPQPRIESIASDDPRESTPDRLLVIEPGSGRQDLAAGDVAIPPRVAAGLVSAAGGASAAAAVETAARLVREGLARGIVTGPLHKAALHAAGIKNVVATLGTALTTSALACLSVLARHTASRLTGGADSLTGQRVITGLEVLAAAVVAWLGAAFLIAAP
jgi:4-hydroxythreonine-4-phosphate dehydrogenase